MLIDFLLRTYIFLDILNPTITRGDPNFDSGAPLSVSECEQGIQMSGELNSVENAHHEAREATTLEGTVNTKANELGDTIGDNGGHMQMSGNED